MINETTFFRLFFFFYWFVSTIEWNLMIEDERFSRIISFLRCFQEQSRLFVRTDSATLFFSSLFDFRNSVLLLLFRMKDDRILDVDQGFGQIKQNNIHKFALFQMFF